MRIKSFLKPSVLGFVLMVASVVTAALIPSSSKKFNANLIEIGSLTYSTTDLGDVLGTGITCGPSYSFIGSPCIIATDTGTTENVIPNSSDQGGFDSTFVNVL